MLHFLARWVVTNGALWCTEYQGVISFLQLNAISDEERLDTFIRTISGFAALFF
ncbi:hypothetical protein [Pectobacterium sp. PL64]|uniref:hypothetical protein n=1 Tax=unclassified Pectobacterium TaxID=2627739 RepID=UPI001F0BB817|nr:hypothetical protein [Pectobacterium sp. PL64]UMO89348.1 hypothetical protein HP572_07445 [Pectobacterium sp. PL64]